VDGSHIVGTTTRISRPSKAVQNGTHRDGPDRMFILVVQQKLRFRLRGLFVIGFSASKVNGFAVVQEYPYDWMCLMWSYHTILWNETAVPHIARISSSLSGGICGEFGLAWGWGSRSRFGWALVDGR